MMSECFGRQYKRIEDCKDCKVKDLCSRDYLKYNLQTLLDVTIITDRRLGIFEWIVHEFIVNRGWSVKDLSELLNRRPATIYGTLSSAKRKLGGKNGRQKRRA